MSKVVYTKTHKVDGSDNVNGDGEFAVNITLNDALAIERNAGTSNQYGVCVDESTGSILDASITAQAVSGGVPALLFGVHISTPLVGTLTISGFTNVSGAATNHVLLAGTAVGWYDFKGGKCNTALVCTLSDATDDVLVLWRAQ